MRIAAVDVLAGEEDVVLVADEVEPDVERRARSRRTPAASVHAMPRALRRQRDRAIDRAGVEQPIAEPARELLGDAATCRPRGAIDRDDDASCARHADTDAGIMPTRMAGA